MVVTGASCPDILMNQVIERVVALCGYGQADIEEAGKSVSFRGERMIVGVVKGHVVSSAKVEN